MISKDRISGLDIIKIIACIFVISLHFISYNCTSITSNTQFLIVHSFRWLTFTCVGLFILCTGYLNCNKKVESKYYIKILSFIIPFFLFSILSGFILDGIKNDISLFNQLYGYIKYYFLNFAAYYWYVNFYICLFLIIPFLNLIINNINKKQHLLFIFILVLLTCLPGFVTQFNDLCDWFKELGIMVPNFYVLNGFSFLFYFIGAYIRKYKEIINKWEIALYVFVLLLCIIGHSLIDLFYCNKYSALIATGDHLYTFNEYGNLFTVIASVSIFVLLFRIKFNFKPLKVVLAYISSLSFEMYLTLFIADNFVSRYLQHFNKSLSISFKSYLQYLLIEFITMLIFSSGYFLLKLLVKKIMSFLIGVVKREKK